MTLAILILLFLVGLAGAYHRREPSWISVAGKILGTAAGCGIVIALLVKLI